MNACFDNFNNFTHSLRHEFWISFLELTQTLFKVLQLIPWIALTGMAAWGVGAVMITTSIVISTLVNVCKLGKWKS